MTTATTDSTALLRTADRGFVDRQGNPVRLLGAAVGGWLNMENFITGYSGNESLMRATVRDVLGTDRYELFFEQLLTSFFGEADAVFMAESGMNCLRLP